MSLGLKNSSEEGFSLIEVALGLLLFSLLFIPLFNLQSLISKQETLDTTTQNISLVRTALQRYVLERGAYPLPADRNLGRGDAGYGMQVNAAAILTRSCASPTVAGRACFTPGERDSDGVPGLENVFVGAVPFAALGLPEFYTIDGYGSKLTYAVTDVLTNPTTFEEGRGVVRLNDNAGNVRRGSENSDGLASAHYVVISHGEDQGGAYSVSGVLVQACLAARADAENCDDDGVFNDNFSDMPSLNNPLQTVYVREQSLVNDASYYDDYVQYSVTTTSDFWTRRAAADDIFSRVANISIGGNGALPQAKVDVIGNVEGNTLRANRLCPSTGCQCDTVPDPSVVPCVSGGGGLAQSIFDPIIISTDDPSFRVPGQVGSGIRCPDNRAMTGISDADEECEQSGFFSAVNGGTGLTECPAGQFPVGTDVNGQLRCEIPLP